MAIETEDLQAPVVPLWKRYFWKNSLSSGVRTVTRLLLGLFLFRLLFSNLSTEEFGFWSLLWSLFGYGILLDFGFGFTAQKAVAQKSAANDWVGLSRMLSTLLWTFVGLSIVLGLSFFLLRGPFMSAVGFVEEQPASFSLAYFFFFGGLALTFPFGLFPEILQGLQRLDLANWLRTASVVLNFIGIYSAIELGAGFPVVVLVSVLTTLLPLVGAMFVVFRLMPELSLSPKLFDWREIRSQLGFSTAAYLITFSNLIMGKSDQAVLGFTLGVGFIAAYQAGYKVSEMLSLFTMQIQEVLSPAAANLHSMGDELGLRELLLKTSHLTFLVVVPLYALCVVYLIPLIQLLTGLDSVSMDVWLVGQFLLFAVFSSQLTNSCSKRILMMCGFERKLLYLSIVEAAANLVVSIWLVYQIGIVGVALGTLIPTVVVGWCLVLPMALRFSQLSIGHYMQYLLSGAWPLLIFAGSLVLALIFWPFPEHGGFVELALRGTFIAGPTVLIIALRMKKILHEK